MYRVYRYPFANAPVGLSEFGISPGAPFRGLWLYIWAPFPTDVELKIGNQDVLGGPTTVESFFPENKKADEFEKALVEKDGYYMIHPLVVKAMSIRWNPWREHQCIMPVVKPGEALEFKFTQPPDYVAVVGEEV